MHNIKMQYGYTILCRTTKYLAIYCRTARHLVISYILSLHIYFKSRLKLHRQPIFIHRNFLHQPPNQLLIISQWLISLFLQKGSHFLNPLPPAIPLRILRQNILPLLPKFMNFICNIPIFLFAICQSQKLLL